MSEEYQQLDSRITRMLKRRENAQKVIADLRGIITEVDTEIQADKLKLAAMRLSGEKDNETI